MLINIAFWWMVGMSVLKGLGWVVCSWWLVFGPMPIAILITFIGLMYISYMFSGTVKFWRSGN